jgi:hypothetical protein
VSIFPVMSKCNNDLEQHFVVVHWDTRFTLSEHYFQAIRAPEKKLIWLEHSAHYPLLEEPEKFNSEVEAIGQWVLRNNQATFDKGGPAIASYDINEPVDLLPSGPRPLLYEKNNLRNIIYMP